MVYIPIKVLRHTNELSTMRTKILALLRRIIINMTGTNSDLPRQVYCLVTQRAQWHSKW